MLETPRTYHQSALAVLQTKTAAGPEMNGFHHQQNQQHPNSKPAGPTTHGTTTECAFIPIEVTTSSSSQYLEIQGGNNSFIPTQPSITFFSASTAAFSSLIPCGNAHLIHSVIVITPGSELLFVTISFDVFLVPSSSSFPSGFNKDTAAAAGDSKHTRAPTYLQRMSKFGRFVCVYSATEDELTIFW